MSAQSIAKAAQGYEPKPVPNVCSRCEHFESDRLLPEWMIESNAKAKGSRLGAPQYTLAENGIEKNLRCTLGGFDVKKMGTCREFRLKVAP